MTDVTQADRDAAAAVVAWHNKVASEWKTNDGCDLQFFTSGMPEQIRHGVWDNHDVVQAFARHRIEATRQLEADKAELVEALEIAARHIEHMAAWISAYNRGYSLEGIGEDMPTIKDALTKHGGKHDAIVSQEAFGRACDILGVKANCRNQ